MKQLHFSVEEETALRLAREAERRGMSLSKYLATLVTDSLHTSWPRGYLKSVVGSCTHLLLEEPPDSPPEKVEL